MTAGAIVVTTTAASIDEAETIVAALLNRRLAACVQLTPIASRYVWKGKVERADEVMLIIKTMASAYQTVEGAIRELHSYETPEILAVDVAAGSADYLAWVGDSVSSKRPGTND